MSPVHVLAFLSDKRVCVRKGCSVASMLSSFAVLCVRQPRLLNAARAGKANSIMAAARSRATRRCARSQQPADWLRAAGLAARPQPKLS
jgi:hypothetical protein